MKRAEKREHLVDVAIDLFNQHGYHASGVDQIIAQAGIAKTTLYRHFASKEDLIIAALNKIDRRFRDDMRAAVDKATRDPKKKVLATFDFLERWFRDHTFYGCPFMAAAGEYGDRTDPIFQAAMMHKRLMMAYFEELTRAAGLSCPAEVAEEINLLHEGATAVAQITNDPKTARKAKSVAAKIIDNASASGLKRSA